MLLKAESPTNSSRITLELARKAAPTPDRILRLDGPSKPSSSGDSLRLKNHFLFKDRFFGKLVMLTGNDSLIVISV